MASSLGVLTLDLVTKIGGFQSGLDAAGRTADKRSKDMEKSFQRMSVSAIAAGSAIGNALSDAIVSVTKLFPGLVDGLDKFNDVKDATGASIENISALDKVARSTGTTIETVEDVLVKFNAALKEAKPDTDSDRLFKALNLNVKELKAIDPAEALRRTAVAFSEFEDNGNKARAMQELFGRSVKEAVPFLNDLAQESQLVGTVSTQSAAQAEQFNKQLSALKANVTDAARAITADLLPALNRALANLTEFKQQGNLGLIFKDAAKDIVGLGKLTDDAGADINNFMKERQRLQKSMDFATRKGLPTEQYKKDIDEVNRYLEVSRTRQRNAVLASTAGQDFGDAVSRRNRAPSLPEISSPGKTPKASGAKATDPYAEASRYLEGLQKQLERTQDLTVAEQALQDIQLGRLGKVSDAQRADILGVAKQIDAAKEWEEQEKQNKKALEEQARAMEKLLDEGKQLYEALLTPQEKFAEQQENINKLLAAGAIDYTTAARAMAKYSTDLQDAVKPMQELDSYAKQAAEGIQDAIGDGLVNILEGNFKDIGKNFGQLLNRMIAEAAAADIARRLFGSLVKGGEGEGVVGSLLKTGASALLGGGASTAAAGSGGDVLGEFIKLKGYATGGFTGAGAVHEPAGIVHKGEYVVDAATTKRMGLDRGASLDSGSRPQFTTNINVQPGQVDRRTAAQIAQQAGMSITRATRRLG